MRTLQPSKLSANDPGAIISIRILRILLGSIALAGLACTQVSVTALGATAPLSDARVAVHFDITTFQQPENITLEPNGDADLTFQRARQVARVTTSGKITVLATLPAPPTGTATVSGIVRAFDGTLYVNYNSGVNSGIYRVPAGGGTPVLVVALPAVAALNGLALDTIHNTLYATDSSVGDVWKVSLNTRSAALWAQGTDLQPAAGGAGLGANGIKVHDGAVWVSNTGNGTLLRVPINWNGTAGTLTTYATGLSGIDDFTFTGLGDQILAAQNGINSASIVNPGGTHEIVLTVADGLQNPTSVAVRGTTVYVASGAYLTHTDPNLMLARLGF
jgi:hypothetical protein